MDNLTIDTAKINDDDTIILRIPTDDKGECICPIDITVDFYNALIKKFPKNKVIMLLDKIEFFIEGHVEKVVEYLMPQKFSKWIYNKHKSKDLNGKEFIFPELFCENCGVHAPDDFYVSKYCPNCGAEMENYTAIKDLLQ